MSLALKDNRIAHITHVAHAHVGWVSIVALGRKYATFAADNAHTLFAGIIALVQAAKTRAATLDAKIISLKQAAKNRTATIHATLRASTISWWSTFKTCAATLAATLRAIAISRTALYLYVYSVLAYFCWKVFQELVAMHMCNMCKNGWHNCHKKLRTSLGTSKSSDQCGCRQ